MSPRIPFADPQAAADAVTFAGRAARLGEGVVRLQARDGTLAMTAAVLVPRGLLDPIPTVLGMRMLAVDPDLECDLCVDAQHLVIASDDPSGVMLPATGLAPAWAGVAPPRGGWVREGEVAASVLASCAQRGIAAVAEAVPTDAGEDAVRAVRAAVWAPADESLGDLPLGAAFAAFGLGFVLGDEQASVYVSGAWSRITLARGHVLVRGARRPGLTPVRRTGPSAN